MTEKTSKTFSEQSVPLPDGTPAYCRIISEGTKWAILINEGRNYRLKEKDLSDLDARKLLTGKYLGRDVILTVSAGDLTGRIDKLNRALR